MPQAQSRAALAAHIASRLAGTGSDRSARDNWLEHSLRVKLRSNGLDRAAQRSRDAIRPWLLVDEASADLVLEKAVVVFPGSGRRRPTLLDQLRRSGAIRQIIVTRSRRDIVCVAVFRAGGRDEVFEAIEALGEAFIWDDVLDEDREIESRLWTDLARRLAAQESLLLDP